MSNLLAHEIAQRHDDLPFPYIMLTPASQAEQVCCQNLLAYKIAQRHYNVPFPYIRIARVGDEHVVEHDESCGCHENVTAHCRYRTLACEAGVSIKPGAQAPGSDHKNTVRARENGRQLEIYHLSPAVAGSALFDCDRT